MIHSSEANGRPRVVCSCRKSVCFVSLGDVSSAPGTAAAVCNNISTRQGTKYNPVPFHSSYCCLDSCLAPPSSTPEQQNRDSLSDGPTILCRYVLLVLSATRFVPAARLARSAVARLVTIPPRRRGLLPRPADVITSGSMRSPPARLTARLTTERR